MQAAAGAGGPPFHRLARPRERSWAGLVLEVVLAVAAGGLSLVAASFLWLWGADLVAGAMGFAPGELEEVLFEPEPGSHREQPLRLHVFALAAAALALGAMAAAIVAVAALVARRPVRSYLTAAPRFRWRLAGAGLIVYLPIVGLAVAVLSLWDPLEGPGPLFWPDAGLAERGAYLVGAVAFLWIAALAEEVVFRGWLLQKSALFIRSAPVVLVLNGVLFSAIHLDPQVDAFIARAVMGALFAWLAIRMGGIEFATGAHFANNLVLVLFVEPITLADPLPTPLDLPMLTVDLAAQLALLGATLAIMASPRARALIGLAPNRAAKP